jgi:O-methyltransferase
MIIASLTPFRPDPLKKDWGSFRQMREIADVVCVLCDRCHVFDLQQFTGIRIDDVTETRHSLAWEDYTNRLTLLARATAHRADWVLWQDDDEILVDVTREIILEEIALAEARQAVAVHFAKREMWTETSLPGRRSLEKAQIGPSKKPVHVRRDRLEAGHLNRLHQYPQQSGREIDSFDRLLVHYGHSSAEMRSARMHEVQQRGPGRIQARRLQLSGRRNRYGTLQIMSENHLSHYIAQVFTEACYSNMMDAPRLLNLGHLIMQTEGVPGDIVEFGCNRGHTALFMRSLTSRPLWLYDSFKGLPRRSEHDIAAPKFVEGALKCSRQECEDRFKALPPDARPIIVEGWFEKIRPSELPDKISFAHIDADFYGSIKTALDLVYYRLTPGAICVIDDYSWPGLPGVKLAVDVFLRDRKEKLVHPTTLYYKAHQCWFVKI